MARKKQTAENTVKNIRRRTRRKYNAEEKIRIVIEGLRGDLSVAELCRREGITKSLAATTSPHSGAGIADVPNQHGLGKRAIIMRR